MHMSNGEKAIAENSRLTSVGLSMSCPVLFQILTIVSKPIKSYVWSPFASSFISMIITFVKFENDVFSASISCYECNALTALLQI